MIQAPHMETVPDVSSPVRPAIAGADRIVLKVGTRVLSHPDGTTALARLFGVVEVAAGLRRAGREVLIVTSGAVGLGRVALRVSEMPETAELNQTCAAVGQSRLMELYQQGFARLGVLCAQILITWTDFDDRVRYLNVHETLQSLFRLGVVPVVNENDAISLNDRVYRGTGKRPIFDDNDRLSALVSSELAADLLVLLTDVPGVMTVDPRRDPSARLVSRIEDPDDHGLDVAGASEAGRGGMASKLEAASIASRGGCHTVIASGLDPAALGRVLAGEAEGTWIPPRAALSARSPWIAYCSHPRGTLIVEPSGAGELRSGPRSVRAPSSGRRASSVVAMSSRSRCPTGRSSGVESWGSTPRSRASGSRGRAGSGRRRAVDDALVATRCGSSRGRIRSGQASVHPPAAGFGREPRLEDMEGPATRRPRVRSVTTAEFGYSGTRRGRRGPAARCALRGASRSPATRRTCSLPPADSTHRSRSRTRRP